MPTTTTCNRHSRCGPKGDCTCVKSGLTCIPAVSNGKNTYCVCGCTCNVKCSNKGDSKTPDILSAIAKKRDEKLDDTQIHTETAYEITTV